MSAARRQGIDSLSEIECARLEIGGALTFVLKHPSSDEFWRKDAHGAARAHRGDAVRAAGTDAQRSHVVDVRGDERIVRELGVRAHTRSISSSCPGESVSFGSRHQLPRQQSLAPQNLVQSGNAAGEGVPHVEERAVRVGERRRTRAASAASIAVAARARRESPRASRRRDASTPPTGRAARPRCAAARATVAERGERA